MRIIIYIYGIKEAIMENKQTEVYLVTDSVNDDVFHNTDNISTDGEMIDSVAKQILEIYREAFLELAK